MTKDELLQVIRSFDGALVVTPGPGDGVPEIAWGDSFCYYAPDGRMPRAGQPYATVVTKDYPEDAASGLGAGHWRVNIGVDGTTFAALTGEEDARRLERAWDYAARDVVLPHPVYAALGWVCVVDPGEATGDAVLELVRAAHDRARARYERRHGPGDAAG